MPAHRSAKGPRTADNRRTGAKLLLAAASIALALLVAELAVRFLSEEGVSLLVKDTIVGHRYRAGAVARPFVREAGKRVLLRFNSDGFRGIDPLEPKPDNLFRIAVLGDSYVAGVAVEEEDLLTSRLARRGRTLAPSREIEVLNFGVSGHGTAQNLLVWRNFVRKTRPDVVVVCFYNGNDLSDNHPDLSTAHRPYFRLDEQGAAVPLPFSAGRVALTRFLADRSALYVWHHGKIRGIRDLFRSAVRRPSAGIEILHPLPPDPYPAAWQLTEAILKRLAEEVRSAGSEFLLVSLPAPEQVSEGSWNQLVAFLGAERAARYRRDHPETKLAGIAERLAIEFLPLREAFAARAGIEELYCTGEGTWGHFNEAGHRVAGEAIAERLAPLLLGPSASRPNAIEHPTLTLGQRRPAG